ncbi:MAG: class I SAM-dependent methyltransferase [Chloracidobacterium sp.]|nr:class I SAM-dependent methyltransferase [Chloracidobacterium sp.]
MLELFRREMGLRPEHVVADIGSGTGFSSRLFLENGNRVFGVEPNDAMRAAGEEFLSGFPNFTSVKGTSDATTLADASCDFVIAAQAFHWFEPEATRHEWRRILKPGGWAALIWNERQLATTPFLAEYEDLLLRYANDYTKVRHENIDETKLTAFFQSAFQKAVFPNSQTLDLDGLTGRVLSSSYMPTAEDPRFSSMNNDLASLVAKHGENGNIELLYDTTIYYSLL